MFKKRIGNDISFTWHIYRKDGDTRVPEDFTGKQVEVKLRSPLQRPVTITDISIATGVVMFTFKGKDQQVLGSYTAVLSENKGADGMVTLDTIEAVTLVMHSYMEDEDDNEDENTIEVASVELESYISTGGGGGFVQQQADWEQDDDTQVNYIKNKPDVVKQVMQSTDSSVQYESRRSASGDVYTSVDDTTGKRSQSVIGAKDIYIFGENGVNMAIQNDSIAKLNNGLPDSVLWESTAIEQLPVATTSANGLMSATDKGKLDALPTATELTQELTDKQDVIDDLATIRSGAQAGATAYQKPNTGIPATDLASAVQVSLGKADTALQEHQSLAGLVNTGSYNTVSKRIELKHDSTVLAEIDATAFIKDGMVSNVTIDNGYIVITFNTDAGKEPISIAITDIFNPNNYYTKAQIDTALSGKQDTISDLATIRSGAAAGATAVQTETDPTVPAWAKASSKPTYTAQEVGALPDSTVIPTALADLSDGDRVDDIEEALSDTVVESIVIDDYSEGSVSIVGDSIASVGNVPVKSCYLPYDGTVPPLVIDGVNYTRAIRKDSTYPYVDGVLAQLTVASAGLMTIYYGFGGGGSYNNYYLDFLYTSTDGTVVDERLARRAIFDVATERRKIELNIPKSGTLTVKAWYENLDSGAILDNGHITNIVRIDFERKSELINVVDVKSTVDNLATVATTGSYNDLTNKPILASVATSGSYNDLNDKPTIAAQVQANWNEVDTTSKAYILNKPTIPTVPTNVSAFNNDAGYLTQHQDISGKADKATTLAGYGITDAKIQNGVITLGSNTITPITQHQSLAGYATEQWVGQQGYLTQHQDISGKENVMPITTATGATLSAVVGNYYRLDNVGTLAITLPTITGTTKLQAITFLLACGSSALVTFVPQGSETILYQEDFALEADTTYEVAALWNGSEWTLSRVIYE